MTLNEFISKYKGATVGYPAGSYVGECLSLVKRYIKDVFNFDPPASGCNGARCYWSIFPAPLGDYFKKVPNTPEAVPSPGDIVVWNEKTGGGYGHIAIVTEASVNSFKSFDQNWGGRHAHIVTHDYSNVYGWLTPLKPQTEPIEEDTMLTYLGMPTETEAKAKLKEHLGENEGECDWGNSEGNRGGHLGAARRRVKELESDLKVQAEYAGTLETQVEKLEAAKELESGKVAALQLNVSTLQEEIEKLKEQIQEGSSDATPISTPEGTLPATIEVNGETWGLNGVNVVDNKLQGNYRRL